MPLRIKIHYMLCGFQVAGAILFALVGSLGFALFSTFFAFLSWFTAESAANTLFIKVDSEDK